MDRMRTKANPYAKETARKEEGGKPLANALIGLFLITAIFLAVNAYKPEAEKIEKISLLETEDTVTAEEGVIKIGVSAMISPKDTLGTYKELIDYIGEKFGKKAVLVQRKTYAEMNKLVKENKVFAAFVCSGPYVTGKEEFGMEQIAVPQIYNDTQYYSYIIVHKDSTITSLKELRGKRFAFTDPLSNTGRLAPTYALALMNETPRTFFSSYIFAGSHDNAIKAVAQKIVDGAAVDHLIWEYLNTKNPEYTSKTKVVERIGPYCMPPLVVNPELEKDKKEKLRTIVLGMHEDKKGREILGKIFIDKFVAVNDSCYDSVREIEEKTRGIEV